VAEDPRVQIKSFNVQEGFLIYVKASLLTGAILASPWIFYQLWIFVAAGLYPHEKRYVYVFLPISLTLFLAGVALAFFFVFPPVLDFLFSFNGWLGIDPDPRISEWLTFVLFLPLGFGIAFQLPLAMLFLERIGIFTVQSYLASWRVSVLVIFIISMVFTPADPYSMFLMAIPLLFLYALGVLMCKYMPRRWSPFE
jgi:sec-independent protein translocase protein TatC